jgi:hypothetical protein
VAEVLIEYANGAQRRGANAVLAEVERFSLDNPLAPNTGI